MNCDPIARWYRAAEYLGMGRALERRRSEFLPQLESLFVGQAPRLPQADVSLGRGRPAEAWKTASTDAASGALALQTEAGSSRAGRALLLGDGDGRFLCAFLAACPAVQVDCVESSAEMIALAKRRVERQFGRKQATARVKFIRSDALEWQPPATPVYRLVSTHFFLDCLTDSELARLLARLAPSLQTNAIWIVSEFAQPAQGLAAWRARLWIGGLYRIFGLFTGLKVRRLPDHATAFEAGRFKLKRRVAADWGLLVSEWWERTSPADFAFDAPGRPPLDSATPKS